MPEDMLATVKKVIGYTWYSKLKKKIFVNHIFAA